jgi:hypothetical protein
MKNQNNVSYCHCSTSYELEPHKGLMRVGLSLQFWFSCDSRVLTLIGWGAIRAIIYMLTS